jgi:hypothetical protein
MSIYRSGAAASRGRLGQPARILGDLVVRTLADTRRICPGAFSPASDYAARLERTVASRAARSSMASTRDQIFTMRPVLGWAQHRTPSTAFISAAPARIPAAA